MGATTFETIGMATTAKAAFSNAVQQAQHEYGHGGYTGTIAEKVSDGFVMITVPKGIDPRDHAEQLMANDDPRISDKWGPAGCIKLNEETFLFFGWASC